MMLNDAAAIVGWIVVLIAIPMFILERRKQAAFDKRFPPITDDEFMALCEPGTNREIALKVRGIISDCLGVDYERIYPTSRLIEDLGCD